MYHEKLSLGQFCPQLERAGYTSSAQLLTYARPVNGALANGNGRWGVLVLPGGGFHMLAPTEGEAAALALLGGGCQAFVLKYSLAPARYPTQLLEAAGALAYLRRHRKQYGLTHVAVCGFSAGGHLAGCLSNLWRLPLLSETLRVEPEMLRPDASILCYPVISTRAPKRSPLFETLLGAEGAEGDCGALSLDTSVSAENPPCFLWATVGDPQVPAEHSLLYAQALRRADVPFELHLFQNGPHAMSVATRESAYDAAHASDHVAHWLPLALEWLHGEALAVRQMPAGNE